MSAAQCIEKHVWSFDIRRHMSSQLASCCHSSEVVSHSTLSMHVAVLPTAFRPTYCFPDFMDDFMIMESAVSGMFIGSVPLRVNTFVR